MLHRMLLTCIVFIVTLTVSAMDTVKLQSPDLVKNPDFEDGLKSWAGWFMRPKLDTEIFHAGKYSVKITDPILKGENGKGGIYQAGIVLNQKQSVPILISGWSKADTDGAGYDKYHYAIHVIFYFDDGSVDYKLYIPFKLGKHNWEQIEELYIPEKPVKYLNVYCRFEQHRGSVWFDDIAIRELLPKSGVSIKKQEACSVLEKELDGSGNKAIVMENGFVKMIFRPENGATCDYFLYKPTNTQFAGKSLEFRLFTDRLQSMNRLQLASTPYSYKIEVNSPEKVSVRFWVTGVGDFPYLELHRIVTIWNNQSEVKVDYEFFNRPEAMAPVVISPYFRHGLNIYGEEDRYQIPTSRGVISSKDSEGGGNKYYNDMVSGWFADNNMLGVGMACEFDFKYLEGGYNWLGGDKCSTLEWWFVPIKIKNGETFRTSCSFIPYRGLPKINGVENGLLCSMKSVADNKLKIDLVSSKKRACKIYLKAVLKPDGKMFTSPPQWLYLNPDNLETLTFQLPAAIDYAELTVLVKNKVIAEFEAAFKPGFTFKAREKKIPPIDVPPKDLLLSTSLETAHINWGKPYCRGKVKALILVSSESAREIIELSQRMDIIPQTIQMSESGFCNQYVIDKYYGNYTYKDANRSLAKRLQDEYDVIIVSGHLWRFINSSNTKQLLEKVNAGTALILITPNSIPKALAETLNSPEIKTPFYKQWVSPVLWQKTVPHFITNGIPFELLPPTPFYLIKNKGKTLITGQGKPIAKVIDGKSRIAIFNYATTSYRTTVGSSLTPHLPVNYQWKISGFWEYYFSLLAKTILWCSHKEPDIRLTEFNPLLSQSNYTDFSNNGLKLTLDSRIKLEKVKLEFNFRNSEAKQLGSLTKSVTLNQGPNSIAIPLPATSCPGINLVNVIIKQGNSVQNWGSTSFELITEAKIAVLKPARETYLAGEMISGVVELSPGKPVNNLVLKVILKDSYDRIIARQDFKSPQLTSKFSFTPPSSLTVIDTIEAVLLKSGTVIDKKTSEIIVTSPRKAIDDYIIQCWVIYGSPKYYLMPLFAEIIKNRIGIDCMYHFRVKPEYFKAYAKHDLQMVMTNLSPQHIKKSYYESSKMYGKTKDKKYLARKPCLNDPEYLKSQKKRIIAWTKPSLKYSPIGYEYGDENSLTLWSNKFDYCFSPHTLAAFRQWLKYEYGTLENLNKEWDTAFPSWEEVIPATELEITAKAKVNRNYAQWADHRTFMDSTFADFYGFCKKIVYSFNPGIPLGISGTQVANSYTGYDWSKLLVNFDMMHSYGGKQQKEYIRSFKKDLNCTSWTCGYGKKGILLEYGIWADALRFRGKGTSFFATPGILLPDFTIPTATADMMKYTRELKNGVGKLLRSCKDAPPDVLIHYSQPSIHAATIEEAMPLYDANRGSWCKLLEDLSLRYKFISYQQIENGDLLKRGVKVLILPLSIAISPREIKEITAFVKRGGTVIADARTAIMNNHCKLLNNGGLDKLFGIKRQTVVSDLRVKKLTYRNLSFSCLLDNDQLQSTTAKTLAYTADKLPVAIYENQIGQGQTIYLNFTINGYASLRKSNPKKSAVFKVLKEVLYEDAGIEPKIKISTDTPAVSGCRGFLFQQKKQNSKASLMGVISDFTVNETSRNIEIKFPYKSYVYDVRKQKFIGYCDKLKTEILPGKTRLYALMPHECRELIMEGVKEQYKPGEMVDFKLALEGKTKNIDVDHVYVVKVYRPDGTLYRYYCRNLEAPNGIVQAGFRLALNDPAGTWKIKAYDVVSGKDVQGYFTLSGDSSK